MTLGNIVSATGSGLACPDWPLCRGRLIPPLAADVLIEYSHRLAAVAASGLLVATIVLTLRGSSAPRARRTGIILVVLLGVQIGLGGATVLLKLPHLMSTAHLVNALLILAGLLMLTTSVRTWAAGDLAVAPRLRRLALAGLAALMLQLALGGYVRHSGAGLACPDWPLCSGALFPGHWLATVHWVHRWLGVALLGLFIHLALAARRTSLATATGIAGVLAALQVVLGILTVLVGLDPAIRAIHAAAGYALWGLLVWVSVTAGAFAAPWGGTPGPERATRAA